MNTQTWERLPFVARPAGLGAVLLRGAGAAALLALVVAGPARAWSPQAVAGTYMEVETQTGGQGNLVKLSLGPDRMRMDMAQGPQQISMISLGGEDGKMLILQHAQKMYMEFTAEMMTGFAGMMGQAQQQQAQQEPENVTPPTFTRTGNTKQIGPWNAYEVRVEHPDQEGEMTMWFSQDVDADFRSLAEQLMDSMSSLLNNPMLRGMSGGGGSSTLMESFQRQMSTMGLPDGFPVQVIANNGGTQTMTTLKAIEQGHTFEASTWEAPADYKKMQVPFRQ